MDRTFLGVGKSVAKTSRGDREHGSLWARWLLGVWWNSALHWNYCLYFGVCPLGSWESISELLDGTMGLSLHSWLWTLVGPRELVNSSRERLQGWEPAGSTWRHWPQQPYSVSNSPELVRCCWLRSERGMQQTMASRWMPEGLSSPLCIRKRSGKSTALQ